ncbi:YlbF family regulator [Dehalobacter sp. DCM]|uniref:YlbF family regulator n=1 Tax=Dehalobacter sp. DCM TaxID=2907827 RepID=UPI0030813175|nr:YlbF family regulator [Dehalobacter sp. DCM]
MMEYIQKARELGEALLNTPEVRNLKEAEAQIANDPEAAKALAEYREKESNMQVATAQRLNSIPSERESLALIDLKMKLIRKYPSIRNFYILQQDYETIMATVNMTLIITIYGMPSAESLPLPHCLKNLAQQLLDNI